MITLVLADGTRHRFSILEPNWKVHHRIFAVTGVCPHNQCIMRNGEEVRFFHSSLDLSDGDVVQLIRKNEVDDWFVAIDSGNRDAVKLIIEEERCDSVFNILLSDVAELALATVQAFQFGTAIIHKTTGEYHDTMASGLDVENFVISSSSPDVVQILLERTTAHTVERVIKTAHYSTLFNSRIPVSEIADIVDYDRN